MDLWYVVLACLAIQLSTPESGHAHWSEEKENLMAAILLVEDATDLVQVIERELEAAGYEVQVPPLPPGSVGVARGCWCQW
jgi:hypothetical protein